MSEEITQLTDRIDRIMRLTAILGTEGKKWGEKILLLSRAGFKPSEIAELLGTTANSVSVELSRLRKQKC